LKTSPPWTRFFEKGPSLKLSEIESSRSIEEIMRDARKEAQAQGFSEKVLNEQ